MGETLGALRTEFLQRGYDGVAVSRANRCINLGARRVCRGGLWPFMLHSFTHYAQGQAIDDLRAVREVYIADHLERGNLRHLHRAPAVPSIGTASSWYFDGASADGAALPRGTAIYLEPGEVANITVVYYRQQPLMVADDDVCIVPEGYSSVVLDAACLEAAKDLREWESVAGFKQELAEGLQEMAQDLIDPQVSAWETIEPAVY